MSDEILQRYRREALQGDAAALHKLEAEILRRREVSFSIPGQVHTEEIEVAHGVQGDLGDLVATVVVQEISSNKAIILVQVAKFSRQLAQRLSDATGINDPEPSRRPSWSPLHVCGMFCDGQDSNSRCEMERLTRCCVAGCEINDINEGREIQIGRRTYVYCFSHVHEAERLQSDADDVLAQDGCTLCEGSGRSPGNDNVSCPACGGSGELNP